MLNEVEISRSIVERWTERFIVNYSKVAVDATGHSAEIVNHLIRKAKVKLATPIGNCRG